MWPSVCVVWSIHWRLVHRNQGENETTEGQTEQYFVYLWTFRILRLCLFAMQILCNALSVSLVSTCILTYILYWSALGVPAFGDAALWRVPIVMAHTDARGNGIRHVREEQTESNSSCTKKNPLILILFMWYKKEGKVHHTHCSENTGSLCLNRASDRENANDISHTFSV